jgi:hypothetical protein
MKTYVGLDGREWLASHSSRLTHWTEGCVVPTVGPALPEIQPEVMQTPEQSPNRLTPVPTQSC